MNETVNKFLLAGDTFKPEKHFTQPGFTYSACAWFKLNKENINLKKQEIQDIFIKREQIKPAFSMILLMKILNLYLEEQLLIKHFVRKNYMENLIWFLVQKTYQSRQHTVQFLLG